jgi:hypothetical protein
MNWHFIGLDLGQSHDFTAIAIIERTERAGKWDPVYCVHRRLVGLDLRYLERLELGTPYPEIVERVAAISRAAELGGRSHLAVDATGVGRPVVDLLRRARPQCRILPAVITGGDQERCAGGYYRVPKRDIVTGLQVLVQNGGLRISAGLKAGPALVREMAEMRVKVNGRGYEQYGAWREGTHDDLVFAVGLACWAAKKMYPRGPEGGGPREWGEEGRSGSTERGRIV